MSQLHQGRIKNDALRIPNFRNRLNHCVILCFTDCLSKLFCVPPQSLGRLRPTLKPVTGRADRLWSADPNYSTPTPPGASAPRPASGPAEGALRSSARFTETERSRVSSLLTFPPSHLPTFPLSHLLTFPHLKSLPVLCGLGVSKSPEIRPLHPPKTAQPRHLSGLRQSTLR